MPDENINSFDTNLYKFTFIEESSSILKNI